MSLIAWLVAAEEPVGFEEIKAALPAYDQKNAESARRMFERDKDELLGLGVPLKYIEDDDDRSRKGYVIDRQKLFLPEIRLDADESAVLYLAGLALLENKAFPYRDSLELALRKIEVASRGQAAAEPVPRMVMDLGERAPREESERRVEALGRAIELGKRVTFAYHAQYSDERTHRTVDPYGLFCRQGHWALVGWCHLRQSVRVFLVHRMDGVEVNAKKRGTRDFEVPEGFVLDAWARVPAWRYELGAPVEVVIEVDAELAWMGEDRFGVQAEAGAEGWRRLAVQTTNPEAVVKWVLALGPRARVVAPAEIVGRVRATLEAVLAGQGG